MAQSRDVRQKLRNQLADYLRKERGDQTLQQFSKKLGISDSSLHRLELSQQNLTLDTLELLLGRLGCDVSDVFKHRK